MRKTTLLSLTLASLVATSFATDVLAQDDIDLGLDDIMSGIDLSDDSDAELLTYSGSADSTAPKFVAGKTVTITHYSGPIRVRCADRDGIAARISYEITGTNEASLARMGKGVGVSTYGSASSGSVKTRVPSKPSGVTSADIELTVNLPKQAGIRINGGRGWVQVTGCEGWVYSRNKEGGAVIDGRYKAVDVSATKGNVKVLIAESSTLTGKTLVAAPGGDATLGLPRSYVGKVYAKGASVSATDHIISGTNNDTLVQGEIGAGGKASVSVTASGLAKITTP